MSPGLIDNKKEIEGLELAQEKNSTCLRFCNTLNYVYALRSGLVVFSSLLKDISSQRRATMAVRHFNSGAQAVGVLCAS